MLEQVSLRDLREIVEKLQSKLKNVAKEAYIFGSIVEGSAVIGESDLDLLIIPDKRIDYFSLLDEEIGELLDLGLVLHLHTVDNVTYRPLLEKIKISGVKIV
jgi:predicted nucleotidyltransferase